MPDFGVIYYNGESALYEFVKGPNANQTFTAVDGTQANAAACLVKDRNGKYVAFNVSGPNAASYVTAFEPANSNLRFVADLAGTAGNSIRIRYVVAGNNTALSVSVASNDITVNLATNGSGIPTSTAAQIKTAIDASGAAAALINTTHAAGSDGSGVPDGAFTFRNLEYGSSGAAVATTPRTTP
jgi:hypothetical protein